MSNVPDYILLIVGAILAVIGGVVTEILKSWLESRKDLKILKTLLLDNLHEVITILENLIEVFKQANQISPAYLEQLDEQSKFFDGTLKEKTFAINKEDLRKDIIAFYKKLKILHKETGALVGLSPQAGVTESTETTEIKQKQERKLEEFKRLKELGDSIKDRLV